MYGENSNNNDRGQSTKRYALLHIIVLLSQSFSSIGRQLKELSGNKYR